MSMQPVVEQVQEERQEQTQLLVLSEQVKELRRELTELRTEMKEAREEIRELRADVKPMMLFYLRMQTLGWAGRGSLTMAGLLLSVAVGMVKLWEWIQSR